MALSTLLGLEPRADGCSCTHVQTVNQARRDTLHLELSHITETLSMSDQPVDGSAGSLTALAHWEYAVNTNRFIIIKWLSAPEQWHCHRQAD